MVAILEAVSLIEHYNGRVGLRNIDDNRLLSFLAICVSDGEVVAIVHEGEARRAEGRGEDEADVVRAGELIDSDQLIDVSQKLCVNDDVESGMVFQREGVHNCDLYIGVKLLKLLKGGVSA